VRRADRPDRVALPEAAVQWELLEPGPSRGARALHAAEWVHPGRMTFLRQAVAGRALPNVSVAVGLSVVAEARASTAMAKLQP
jgi:hypothetical protein